MYHAPGGDRTFEGPEAELLRLGLWEIHRIMCGEFWFGNEDELQWGIPVFDQLTRAQKIWTMVTVGESLLCEDVPPCDLTACTEGAVATIILQLQAELECEIDLQIGMEERGEKRTWRSMREMLLDLFPPVEDMNDDPDCIDISEWDCLIDAFEDCVLHDSDYLDGHLYLDKAPEQAEVLRAIGGIERKYYTTIPHDPQGNELEALIERFEKLVEGGER